MRTTGASIRAAFEHAAGGVQVPQVERRVVRDQDGVAREREEARQRVGDRGRRRDHLVRDPGERGHERRDRVSRVHERREGVVEPPAAHADGADLGDSGEARRAAGRLEIDDHELGLVEHLREQRVIADGPPPGRLVEVEARIGLEEERHQMMRELGIGAGMREDERRELVGRRAGGPSEQMVVEAVAPRS